jgi:hypothetical protein
VNRRNDPAKLGDGRNDFCVKAHRDRAILTPTLPIYPCDEHCIWDRALLWIADDDLPGFLAARGMTIGGVFRQDVRAGALLL